MSQLVLYNTFYNTVMYECIYIVMNVCVDNILLQHPLHTGNITQFAHGRLTDHIYASTIYVCIYIYIYKRRIGGYTFKHEYESLLPEVYHVS